MQNSQTNNQEEKAKGVKVEEALTKDGVGGIHGDLVLGRIADEPLSVSEGYIRRGCAIPLVISDDLNAIMLPHAHTRIGSPEINPDRRTLAFRHGSETLDTKIASKAREKRNRAYYFASLRARNGSSMAVNGGGGMGGAFIGGVRKV